MILYKFTKRNIVLSRGEEMRMIHKLEEIWNYWRREEFVGNKIYFEKLIYESLKLKIYFSMDEENRFLTMTFDQPISYRYSNDSQRIKSTDALLQKHGDDFFNKHSFFKVTNSNDIENFNRATKNQYKDLIQMFVIVAVTPVRMIIADPSPLLPPSFSLSLSLFQQLLSSKDGLRFIQ